MESREKDAILALQILLLHDFKGTESKFSCRGDSLRVSISHSFCCMCRGKHFLVPFSKKLIEQWLQIHAKQLSLTGVIFEYRNVYVKYR